MLGLLLQEQTALSLLKSSLAHLQEDLLYITSERDISIAIYCRSLVDDLSHPPYNEQPPNLPILRLQGSQEWVGTERPALNMEHRQYGT